MRLVSGGIVLLFLAVAVMGGVEVAGAITTYHGHSQLPEQQPHSEGQLLYQEMGCVMCHGPQGDGEGFLAEGLKPKPRNFTSIDQMARIPDMQMANAIRNGIPNTAMPSFKTLTDQQITDLIAYVRSFMADVYQTVNICINEENTLSLASLELPADYSMMIDRPEFLEVKKDKEHVVFKPQMDLMIKKTKGFTERQTFRVHVLLISGSVAEHDRKAAFVAVRIHNCFK